MKIVKKIILAATVCTAIIAAMGCTKNESSKEVKESNDDSIVESGELPIATIVVKDYGTIVAMYYIKKNKGNNISSYDITQEEANKITYKYFGVKDIDISKEDDNFSIKKKNNGYTISWKSTSCGFKKYEITELYYEENIVKLKVEEFSLNENNEYELSLNKHFTLEFKDGYYRILKINSKIEGEEGYVEY